MYRWYTSLRGGIRQRIRLDHPPIQEEQPDGPGLVHFPANEHGGRPFILPAERIAQACQHSLLYQLPRPAVNEPGNARAADQGGLVLPVQEVRYNPNRSRMVS